MATDDQQIDWDPVYISNYKSAAFKPINWTRQARCLLESAKRLEPDIEQIWNAHRAAANGETISVPRDFFQGPYFMLLAFAIENLLKAAIISHCASGYRASFRMTKRFPEELKKHDLVKLAQMTDLSISIEEEDLLRRLTRSAIWFGRYPAPLDYSEMSGQKVFSDNNEYLVSWFGGSDVSRLRIFIQSLPARLGLTESNWESVA